METTEKELWNAHMKVRKEIEEKLGCSFKYVSSKMNGNLAAVVYRHEYAEVWAPCQLRYAKHDILFAINLSANPQWKRIDDLYANEHYRRHFQLSTPKNDALQYSDGCKDKIVSLIFDR